MEVLNTYSPSSVSASTSKSASPVSTQTSAPSSQHELTSAGRPDNSPANKLQKALASLDIPELSDNNSRVELNFNQDTGRVVAKITDRASGEVLRELPSKELQQLFSQMREYLGSVVDEEI